LGSEDKILLIRFSSLGDILLTIPTINTLRKNFPDSEIDFLTHSEYEKLLKYSNLTINKIIGVNPGETNKPLNFIKIALKLRKENYKHIIDLHSNLKSLIISELIRPFQILRVKKYIFRRFLFINTKINLLPDKKIRISRSYLKTLNGIVKEIDNEFQFKLNREECIDTCSRLPEITVDNYIVFSPFSPKKTKEWLPDKYIKLGREILNEYKNIKIVITGLKTNQEEGEYIKRGIGNGSINLCGKTDIFKLACIISNAKVLISGDSGPAHLASALNIPSITIFGPTTTNLGFKPLGAKSIIIQEDLSCRPCSRHGTDKCPEKHFRCMRDINVDGVWKPLKTLLKK
jgi:lipopolysaccharide heptosyltransferase II